MDETNGELENTDFLLQKLQELKNWQKYQEEQLLQNQQFKLDQILQQAHNGSKVQDDKNHEHSDDDTTIDQDLSSLHSEMASSSLHSDMVPSTLPSWASRSSSSLRNNKGKF